MMHTGEISYLISASKHGLASLYWGRGGTSILSLFLEGRGVGFFRYKTKFLGVGG